MCNGSLVQFALFLMDIKQNELKLKVWCSAQFKAFKRKNGAYKIFNVPLIKFRT